MKTGRQLLDTALQMRREGKTLHAADYLHKAGISYELSLIALAGLRRSRDLYGLDELHFERRRYKK